MSKEKGLLSEGFFSSASFSAMSKLPRPSLLKIIFTIPSTALKLSKLMVSPSPLKSSFTLMVTLVSPAYKSVSPANGALLIMLSLSIVTCACGKLLNKLKSTSSNAMLAFTFSFNVLAIISLILSLNKKGAAANAMMVTKRNIPSPFKTFFNMIVFFEVNDFSYTKVIPIVNLRIKFE